MAKKRSGGISFPIQFEKDPPKSVDLAAYVFDREGNLLEETKVSKDQVQFKLSKEKLQQARMFIAPIPPEERGFKEPSLEQLQRLGAYEPITRYTRNNEIELLPVPGIIVDYWWWIKCRVTGKVVKWFKVDGVWKLLPICNAKVHICEVDPIRIFIYEIPDEIILKLRDVLLDRPLPELEVPPQPIDPPLPDPPPFRISGAAQIQPISARAKALPKLQESLQFQLNRNNVNAIREAVIENYAILSPYICLYPLFWPYFYRCDEIKSVVTDHQGRFDTNIYYQAFGDKPDLYFWVEKEINGVMTAVYKPNIPCNTYWDYECGKELTIYVSHPEVQPGCPPTLEGEIAWIQTIGHGASVTGIQQTDHSINIQGQAFNTIGLTSFRTGSLDLNASIGLAGQKVRPFAKNMHFRVLFGNGTGPGQMVSKFLWSYRKIRTEKLLNSSAADKVWEPLNGVALKKAYYVPNASGTDFITKFFDMGPAPDGYYLIPPYLATSIEADAIWADAETVTASFDSAALKYGDGLYEFKLEVFNNAGALITVGKDFYRVNGSGGSTAAPVDYFDPGGGFKPFRMRARIDNKPVSAQVEDIEVDGNTSSSACGFVKYNAQASKVKFKFEASHPNDFAVFNFTVNRGKGNPSPASDAGMVLDDTAKYDLKADGFFHGEFTVAQLLGPCPGKAAFAEYLYVKGLHTNGSWIAPENILSPFHASFLAAFALEPV